MIQIYVKWDKKLKPTLKKAYNLTNSQIIIKYFSKSYLNYLSFLDLRKAHGTRY